MLGLRKRTWVIGGLIAALIGTGAIASRYHNRSMEDRVDFATYMISKKLELNDTQEASLDALAASWADSAGTMKMFRKSMINEIKSLSGGEDLSVEQVNALRDKVKAEIDRRTDRLVPELVTFYNGLDSDQRSKISDRLDKMAQRMEEGKFMRHHGDKGRRHYRWHDKD